VQAIDGGEARKVIGGKGDEPWKAQFQELQITIGVMLLGEPIEKNL